MEPEASAETPRRAMPALTPALKEAVRAAHPDEMPETSPPSKEEDDGVDALVLMRRSACRRKSSEQSKSRKSWRPT